MTAVSQSVASNSVVLKAADGSCYSLAVTNGGVLTLTSARAHRARTAVCAHNLTAWPALTQLVGIRKALAFRTMWRRHAATHRSRLTSTRARVQANSMTKHSCSNGGNIRSPTSLEVFAQLPPGQMLSTPRRSLWLRFQRSGKCMYGRDCFYWHVRLVQETFDICDTGSRP